jgi:thiol-disulfide isomerase/thioredoxin
VSETMKLKRNLIFSLLCLLGEVAFCQTAEVVKFETLKKIIEVPSGNIQVINFWATWCAPCVKELPYFEALNANKLNVSVTLVNLDFAEKIDKVNAFINRKALKSKVLLLDEIDYNSWIDKVDKSWSGAIPATLIINPSNGKRKFVESSLQEGDLEKLIKEVQ